MLGHRLVTAAVAAIALAPAFSSSPAEVVHRHRERDRRDSYMPPKIGRKGLRYYDGYRQHSKRERSEERYRMIRALTGQPMYAVRNKDRPAGTKMLRAARKRRLGLRMA